MGDIAERIAQAKAKVTDLKVIIYVYYILLFMLILIIILIETIGKCKK